jgi:hypothetical protein
MKRLIELSEQDRLHLSSSSIAICGLARNCARSLPENIKFIEHLRGLFADSVVVVVENDSTDKTRMLLDQWANQSNGVDIIDGDKERAKHVTSNPNVNPYYSRSRVTRLAHFRNQYLSKIFGSGKSFDYLLVIDWDVDKISWDGVIDSFIKRNHWDIVTAYGYSISPKLTERYYDTYALVLLGDEAKPQTEKSIKLLQHNSNLKGRQHEMLKVYSAFGGFAIYKFSAIQDLFYGVLDNQDSRVEVRCEHFSLFQAIHEKIINVRVLVNPAMRLRFDRFSNILLRKFSDVFN